MAKNTANDGCESTRSVQFTRVPESRGYIAKVWLTEVPDDKYRSATRKQIDQHAFVQIDGDDIADEIRGELDWEVIGGVKVNKDELPSEVINRAY